MDLQIKVVPILVAAIVSVVIGGLWFSPLLFANRWMAGIGKSPEQVQKEFTPMQIVGALVGGLVAAATLCVIIHWVGADSLLSGAGIGLFVAVGLLTSMNGVNYWFEHRAGSLFLINNAHDIVSLTVMGAIIGAWY